MVKKLVGVVVEDLLVEGVEVGDHFGGVELFGAEVAAGGGHLGAAIGVVDHPVDGFAELGDVAGFDEAAGLAINADFGGAVAIVGDDGHGTEQRLGQGARQTFAVAGVHENIHGADERWDLLGRNHAGDDDAALEIVVGEFLFETLTPPAVADPEEFGVRLGLQVVGERVDEVVVAFEFGEAGDGTDDEVVIGEVVFGAGGGAVICRVKK